MLFRNEISFITFNMYCVDYIDITIGIYKLCTFQNDDACRSSSKHETDSRILQASFKASAIVFRLDRPKVKHLPNGRCARINTFINGTLLMIIINIFTVIVSFTLMFSYYWKLAALC